MIPSLRVRNQPSLALGKIVIIPQDGATTLSMKTLIIMTFSILDLIVTLGIMTGISIMCHYAVPLFILNVIVLNVIELNVFMLNVIMLNTWRLQDHVIEQVSYRWSN
jgi:hypothetical protein